MHLSPPVREGGYPYLDVQTVGREIPAPHPQKDGFAAGSITHNNGRNTLNRNGGTHQLAALLDLRLLV